MIESGSAPEPEEPEEIGFPAFATRNTTRVGGADSIATRRGVALASYPSLGGVGGPPAVILAPADTWQEALAATPLTAAPVEAPLLLGSADEVPEPDRRRRSTGSRPRDSRTSTAPRSSRSGTSPPPTASRRWRSTGADAAEIAATSTPSAAKLTGEEDPAHLLVVSSDRRRPRDAGGRLGRAIGRSDPVRRRRRGARVDGEGRRQAPRHPGLRPRARVGDLGEGDRARSRRRARARSTRVGEEDPVENSIAFARFVDGDFGWNINDPGHGFMIANSRGRSTRRSAAPLSAGGKPGPLLVTDDAEVVPDAAAGIPQRHAARLTSTIPSRAVYNHVWLLGDPAAISVPFQAQVDELTKLAPVEAGTSSPRGSAPTPTSPRPTTAKTSEATRTPTGADKPADYRPNPRERGWAPGDERGRASRPAQPGAPARRSRTSARSPAPPPPTSRSRSATGSRR